MSKPEETFYKSLFEPNWQQLLGSEVSNALKSDSFSFSFMHLELRREHKEDYIKARKSKAEIGLQDS